MSQHYEKFVYSLNKLVNGANILDNRTLDIWVKVLDNKISNTCSMRKSKFSKYEIPYFSIIIPFLRFSVQIALRKEMIMVHLRRMIT